MSKSMLRNNHMQHQIATNFPMLIQKLLEAEDNKESDEDEYVPYVSVRDRKRAVLQKHGGRLGILMKQDAEKQESSANESEGEVKSESGDPQLTGPTSGDGRSLLDQHSELKKKEEGLYSNSVFSTTPHLLALHPYPKIY